MIDPFWLSLVAKMVTSAGIVVAASLLVERAGPFFGAMIATLPISAGPAYAFLALEHGPLFVERSSLMSLAVNASTAFFLVTYAILAQRRSLVVSLGIALLLWFGMAWIVAQFAWTLSGAIVLNVASFAVCFSIARRYVPKLSAKGVVVSRWWDVPARAAGVMILVGGVVLAGRVLGPTAAGITALVPMVLTSLALILHPRVGGPLTASMYSNGLPGMMGFSGALIVLHATVVALGAMAALAISLAVCLCWNTGLILFRR